VRASSTSFSCSSWCTRKEPVAGAAAEGRPQ